MMKASNLYMLYLVCALSLGITSCVVAPPATPETGFAVAARTGDIGELRRLHEAGVSVNAQMQGFTALMHACITGQVEAARYLIANGANMDTVKPPSFTTPASYTALQLAASNGHREIMVMLVAAGADPRPTYQEALDDLESFSTQLGNVLVGGESENDPYRRAVNLIESKSPWFQNGQMIRPSSEALANARARAAGVATTAKSGGGGNADLTRLRELKSLLDDGVITQEEFDEQKKLILLQGR